MLGFKAKSRHDEDEDKDQDKDTVSADVVKVIEIIGTSDQGFEEAIAVAIKTAASSLRHITGADVKHMTVAVKNGKVAQYRVDLKVAFALDEDD